MKVHTRRVRAIVRKELREYRRNRQILVAMAVLPLIFSVQPFIQIFVLPASAASSLRHVHLLAFMLGVPALVPATVAASAVAGERVQGTLEPVLTTPIRREEFLLGKALAALLPTLVVSYGVFGVFVVAVELFAQPSVAAAVVSGPELLAPLLFTPLVAAWSIWLSIAISARSSDPRVAAQFSVLASLPSIVVTTAVALAGIRVTLAVALGLALALLLADGFGWRMVSVAFDRERLIIGTKS